LAGFDVATAAEETWDALLSAGALKGGQHILANGDPATIKVDAEVLDKKPPQRAIIIGHVATFPCVKNAQVLLYVPDGMKNFTNELGEKLHKPVAQARRPENAMSRYEFEFISGRDRDLALSAEELELFEDIVSTLGSVAGMVEHLDPRRQNIHTLAFLLRGTVNPDYQKGITDHYLAKRAIPLDKNAFLPQLSPRELELYKAGQMSDSL
jgi:hypothetical protein